MIDLFGNERRFLRRRIEVLNHQKRVLQNHLRDVSAARHVAEATVETLKLKLEEICSDENDDR